MKRTISLLIIIFTLIPIWADSNKHQSVGLVLSGGGAKGIAHIGVIQALEENNIPIDYIAGTSMGAIVGGLYAAGYTPQEMLQLILSPDFSHWSTGKIDEDLTYFFAKNSPTPALASFNTGRRDSTIINSVLPKGLINPLPMNFAFMELFAPHTAQCNGDFDKLFVPFRCVASDITHKHKVVCRDGQLGDAIRASMTFPIVFYPIKVNGTTLYDGGIYDNFPVDVMKTDFAPSVIIGVNVSIPDKRPVSDNIMAQLSEMIMQDHETIVTESEGIYIPINLNQYNLLDFPKAQEIYDKGYNKAMSMMDSITTRITTRVSNSARQLKRNIFKSQTPYLRFDSVNVAGGTDDQNQYLKYVFTHGKNDTLTVDDARKSYYQALSPDKLKDLMPHAIYRPQDDLFTLQLDATVKDNFRLGFGGYATSSTNSMLFLSGGYNTLSYNSLDANFNVWIGQSYMAAEADARMFLRTPTPSYFQIEGVASRHKYYENDNLFYEDNIPTFISQYEYFGRLKYCIAAGRRGKFELAVGGGHLLDRFYQSTTIDFATQEQDKTLHNLASARVGYTYHSLDNDNYPSAGAVYKATFTGVMGNSQYYSADPTIANENEDVKWLQLNLKAEKYFNISRSFALGAEFNALASTRKLMNNYYASIVQASAFTPTPSWSSVFNPGYRANSYVTAGLIPIWKITDNLQLRGETHAFMPIRPIEAVEQSSSAKYGSWISRPHFMAEAAFVFNLPFATLSAYVNFKDHPTADWNFGVSFGLYFLAPRFLN